MKLSKKQLEDLETVKYFIPSGVEYAEITDKDIERYFAWSDRGIGKAEIAQEATGLSSNRNSGMAALYWGKQRRDLQVTSYIEDWGKYITSVDFVDEPKFLVEWLSRVMKKPGLLDMWVMFNEPKKLTRESEVRLAEAFAPFLVTTLDPVVYTDPQFKWLADIMKGRYAQWVTL